MDGGIPPVRSFLAKRISVIINLELKVSGIFPDSLLNCKLRYVSFGQLDMLAGISPLNELWERDNLFNRYR
ncbi:hypothetical protein HanIR_Chr14g0724271 [Helianthus annuus]|nr:hypothetical protein HanIR_Chr14g0724271 [Helianthus annuus]